MPRERESELRHLGGNVLHQMHSSCAKKMTVIRQKELPEFDVLTELKGLSNNADRLAKTELKEDVGLDEWFAALRKTMEDIRDCKNVKAVQYPPSIKTFIDMKNKNEKVPSPGAIGTAVSQVTLSATKEVTPVKDVIASSASKMPIPNIKEITPDTKPIISDTQMVTPATSVRKKANPFVLLHQITNQNINILNNENSIKNNHTKPQTALQTPVLNLTFDKINTTVVLDSGSASNSNQNSSVVSTCNDSGVKMRSSKKNNLHSAKKENDHPNSHGMLTRTGSKRKSSDNKNKSSKKQKVDSLCTSSATLKKTQPRRPLRDLKTSVLASENKNKLSAVIKPPVQPKQSVVSKEQQILEEIKKKEKKREENLQRVMAERQQKAEQIKKNREEKRTKTLQKRLQMEKEKEEKREIETKKPQVKVNKENAKKTRTKELVEQHVKESKSSNIISSTQTATDANALVLTPAPRKSEDCESYELTPLPDSSTYNFSDDDDDERPANNKRIPAWAQGVQLKSALIQQYYTPLDTDELFGSVIETPNLVEIFKINKKHYFKRTSSAIWNSPPDRPFRR